jgi:hypothetical protein
MLAIDLNANNSKHVLKFADTVSQYRKIIYTKSYDKDLTFIGSDPIFNKITYTNCSENGCNFLNIGKGYLRKYLRISYNSLQQTASFAPLYDRLDQWTYTNNWSNSKDGYILLLAPKRETLKYYTGYDDVIQWCNDIKNQLRNYTDKKIFVRLKDVRSLRGKDPITMYFDGCYATVSLQSVGCIESIIHGIPAFTIAPSALSSFDKWNNNISNIENIVYPTDKSKWLNVLANSQFTPEEIKNGFALDTIEIHNNIKL